jgi:hypothetical protein
MYLGKRQTAEIVQVSDETVKYGYWALMTWLVSDRTVNYRPVFLSAKAPSKEEKSNCQRSKKSKIKSGQGSQRETRCPDALVNWLSAGRRTPTPRDWLILLPTHYLLKGYFDYSCLVGDAWYNSFIIAVPAGRFVALTICGSVGILFGYLSMLLLVECVE